MAQGNISSTRIGDIVKDKGWVTPEQLAKALETQRKTGGRLGQILMQAGHITEDQLSECLAQQMGIPHLSIRFHQLDDHIVDLIPKAMATRLRIIPLDHIGSILTVAISDGLTQEEIEEIAKQTGCKLKFYFITASDFEYAFEIHYVRRVQEGGGQEKAA